MNSGQVDYNKILEDISTISGDIIELRHFKMEDADDFFEIARDEETTKYLTWYPHKKVEDSIWSIENIFNINPGAFAIILKKEKRCIGCIDLRVDEVNKKGSFGYVLNRNYWGNGYMSLALKMLLDISFNKLNLNRVESTHYVGNEASGAVMKKCGMIYEGTFKEEVYIKEQFFDVIHYGIIKKNYQL